ncbi:MAG: Tryptophan--tRNA ligase [Candidatus Bathyarchaeota archaeon BA2]|nr:MAG: Tryptophan--tRNA ligase [Candidatus Bathyarchaeota archaeon BA2]
MSTAKKRKTVLDPWGTTIVEDYNRLYEEFGIQPFKSLLSEMPNPGMYMRRGVIFGHRDFELVLNSMKSREKFAVMSGIKPTGEFHLGTLMTAREIIYFQQQGATAFYCIADIEAYEDNKIPFEKSEKIAVGNVADLLALGFDPERGCIYRQYKEQRVRDLAVLFGRGVTLATMKAIYGERNIGLYLSALVQAGDILMPQLKDFDGPKPTVVPVGVDQDAHLRLTRDLASKFRRKFNFISPSSTYHKIMKGLDGSPKMAKRSPMSYFTLHEKPESIAKKISYAFTGGRPTVEEQRKLGGVPEICPVYEICMYHFVEDDDDIVRVYHDCKSGKLLCGEHKAQTTEIVLNFVREHQLKRRKFIDKAREILQVN